MSGQGTVDAILMASGFSRRFGEPDKLLYPFRGKPLAAHALELVCAMPEFVRILFVCASPEVTALAEGLPVRVIHNANPGRGQCESIRLGVEVSCAEHYLFVPCDQPLLDAETVRAVLARRAQGRIVVPAYDGKPGTPALFSAAFRAELLALADGENARSIKRAHPQAVLEVPLPSPLPLRDIDTLQDLEQLLKPLDAI